MPRIRVVLVRPEQAVNIGAVARAMKNAGLDELALVEPGDWRTLECWRSARGAWEILEQAQVHASLDAALAGAHAATGFSRHESAGVAFVDVRELAQEVAMLPRSSVVALVFGPERTGLTLTELVRCGRRALIPSHPGQPSLNLSHAVMVAGYEIHRARRRPRSATPCVTQERKRELLPLVRKGLEAVGGLPPKNSEKAWRGWEAMVMRADLTATDLRRLDHLARRLARFARD